MNKNFAKQDFLMRFLKYFEVEAITMFSGKEFHADTILYAKEELWVFDLSFRMERWREWPHGEVLYGKWYGSIIVDVIRKYTNSQCQIAGRLYHDSDGIDTLSAPEIK